MTGVFEFLFLVLAGGTDRAADAGQQGRSQSDSDIDVGFGVWNAKVRRRGFRGLSKGCRGSIGSSADLACSVGRRNS